MRAVMLVAILVMHSSALTTTFVRQSAALASQSPAETRWPPAGVFRPGGDVTAPRLLKSGRPNYPPEAMRAKIQGSVALEAVIQADGTVGEVRVKRSLDRKFGLDDAALKSLKDYRFAPGTRDGVPVPVLVSMEVSFALRK